MSTFLEKLSSLLNIDGDEAKKLLDDSSIEELVTLTAAVTNQDQQQAMGVMKTIQSSHNFGIGDIVSVDGKRATVADPNTPGDTMKVIINGKPEMVNKRDVKSKKDQVDESTGGQFKLKWTVDQPPTGPYRSFQKRSFPSACYADGSPAVSIRCSDDYEPALVKIGKHSELTVALADWSDKRNGGAFVWKSLKKRFATLSEAKTAAFEF